jgi:hypothetical protein
MIALDQHFPESSRLSEIRKYLKKGAMNMYETHAAKLAEYRNDDGDKRLHMYLQFPRLRSEFYQIDKGELKKKLSVNSLSRRRSLMAQLNAIISSIANLHGKL